VPTYDYLCEKCKKRFAVIRPMSAYASRAPACPRCKSGRTRQLLAAFYAKTVKKS
jgi:putative FmdB family regulatory protein